MAEATAGQYDGRKNLKPFKPGQSGNPAGINGATKRRQQLQEICQRVLGKQVKITKNEIVYKMSGIEAICEAMRNEAIKGDVGAATWCRDTAYGKPVQALSNPDGGPLVATIIYGGVVPPSQAALAGVKSAGKSESDMT